VLAQEQCDLAGAARQLAGLEALGGQRREAAPGDLAGEAQLVEPGRVVVGDAPREDLALPGLGGQLEALELLDDPQQALGSVQLGAGLDVLPAQQEADQLRGRDRPDVLAQAAEREAMDAVQDAALAPLDR
jgi:hypothetical protein